MIIIWMEGDWAQHISVVYCVEGKMWRNSKNVFSIPNRK